MNTTFLSSIVQEGPRRDRKYRRYFYMKCRVSVAYLSGHSDVKDVICVSCHFQGFSWDWCTSVLLHRHRNGTTDTNILRNLQHKSALWTCGVFIQTDLVFASNGPAKCKLIDLLTVRSMTPTVGHSDEGTLLHDSDCQGGVMSHVSNLSLVK